MLIVDGSARKKNKVNNEMKKKDRLDVARRSGRLFTSESTSTRQMGMFDNHPRPLFLFLDQRPRTTSGHLLGAAFEHDCVSSSPTRKHAAPSYIPCGLAQTDVTEIIRTGAT